MQYIERKSMLYKTGVEYGDYTINHVLGCAHGCKYPCYAMMQAKRFGRVKSYEDWCNPKLATNAIEIIRKEIPRLKKDIKSVQLCFTTDPFMYGYNKVIQMSLDIIGLLNKNEIKCIALTKGILPEELSKYSKDNEYGITLVSLDESFRKEYEPNTSPYIERIDSLKYMHNKGFKTWVSIEPYPTPNIFSQDLYLILNQINFVDKIVFGRLNYNPLVTKYKTHKEFYNERAYKVIEYCTTKNIDFHIKEGTITDLKQIS